MHQHRLQLEPRPEMYFSYLLWTNSTQYLLVRTSGDAKNQIAALQGVIWSIDEDVPISRTMTMDEVIGRSIADTRFLTQLLAGFALLALALGAIGVYGVLSYAVSQRTQEIGLRMALGAPQRVVLGSALGKGIALVTGGVVVGIIGAAATSGLLAGFLYGVSATDPIIFAAVGLFLIVVATVASFVPARRASRIDPMLALRLE
jgi:putative ABC transport system permease protein